MKQSRIFPWIGIAVAALALFSTRFAIASDHADPLDIPAPWELFDDGQPSPKKVQELGGGLTDLFIFPVKENGEVAFVPPRDEYFRTDIPAADLDKMIPEQRLMALQLTAAEYAAYKAADGPDKAAQQAKILSDARQARYKLQELTDQELQQIHSVVVILCLNRDVIKPPPYLLEPYTYTIFMDRHTPVSYDKPEDQSNRARYGGTVVTPKTLSPDISITMKFANDGTMKEVNYSGFAKPGEEGITVFPGPNQSGLRDDPFIFQRFFKKNVIAAVFKIPLTSFPKPATPDQWILWATSKRGSQRIDHDGRSLRTQQPRFNFLNGYDPKDQADAVKAQTATPDLYPDLFLRFGFDFVYEYRPWDVAPDVVIYNQRYRTRYPNGRMLTDDVIGLLARNGDSLLMELAFKNGVWPRATANDKPFLPNFPYLGEPWAWSDVTPPPLGHPISMAHKMLLIGIGLVFAIVFLGLGLIIGKAGAAKHRRDEYL